MMPSVGHSAWNGRTTMFLSICGSPESGWASAVVAGAAAKAARINEALTRKGLNRNKRPTIVDLAEEIKPFRRVCTEL